MSKFNTTTARPAGHSPITSEPAPSGTTFEGGAGYARDTKSELFLLAVANMVGENTFYEAADQRDDRYRQLVRAATLADPAWTARFLRWLRTDANLRSASLVGAVEFAHARLDADLAGLSRQVVDSVLQRADEPGELLACWTSRYGRAIPKPVKRGVADAVKRLYTQRSLLKWDSEARGFRFGDVLNLTHPTADTEEQAQLFVHALDLRHGHVEAIPAALTILGAHAALREHATTAPEVLVQTDTLRQAGFTWEAALSLAGSRVPKKDLWEALIPTMGYMALLRNLRNFDEASVSDQVADLVSRRLADPVEVAKSRQMPMRFLSAYRVVPSLRWAWALERAITLSLANIPTLGGRTLILVDTSASMNSGFSKDGSLMRWDAAAVFGIALGLRCEHADVVSFSNGYHGGEGSKVFDLRSGESLLRAVERWQSGGFFINGGTDTVGAVQCHRRPGFHDRVVILTDEQHSYGDVGRVVPANLPLYTWNLAGYQHGHAASGTANRHTFGGLTDQAFRMIPLLESGRNADWDAIFGIVEGGDRG